MIFLYTESIVKASVHFMVLNNFSKNKKCQNNAENILHSHLASDTFSILACIIMLNFSLISLHMIIVLNVAYKTSI